jgi:hypothetical protein
MHGATNVFAQLRLRGTGKRMSAKQFEYFEKASKIRVSDINTELLVAEFTNLYEIAARSRA